MPRNKEGRPEWFKFWRKNRPLLMSELLDRESRGKILENMFLYFDGEELVEMEPVEAMAWEAVKQNIDEANWEYIERSEINHDNGIKGGRPPKENRKNPIGF